MSDLYTVRGGLVTLGPELVRLMDLLDAHFRTWAREAGAAPMLFPTVIGAAELASIDYFDNFPHLALMTAPLRLPADGGPGGAGPGDGQAVAADRLGPSEYGLVSAACYHVYLHHRSTGLTGPRFVTTVAKCFRNEDHYDGLRRLRGFTMREIVCLGPRAAVLEHLAAFRTKVVGFAAGLGLDLTVEAASDPFFAKDGGRALLAQLFPVKEEFVHGSALAIGSLNFHRNFFGERCHISLPDGGPAYTGCVAFGLERWIAALLETHSNVEDILRRVAEATS